MERTIRVTGKGRIFVKPDTIRLQITQESVENTYEGAVRESAEKKRQLNDALEKFGFAGNDLKTLYFNVDTEYESYQDKNKCWKKRLVGYKYTHRMKLEFPSDNKLLSRVLLAVARCPGKPEFTISFTVADKEAAKNELLAKAVEDSKAKAAVLTAAAGVQLKEVLTIDYSWGEMDFVTRPMNEKICVSMADGMDDAGIDMDIEADDIDVTDTVTVVWAIA